MLLPMYLCHYMQESVHGKDLATSTYGHTCQKADITQVSKNTIMTEHVKRTPSCWRGWGELAILHVKLSYTVYLLPKIINFQKL